MAILPIDNPKWLGSAHGTDATRTGTLNKAAFPSNDYPDGIVPGGTAVGKDTATGLYGPFGGSYTDGAGFLISVTDVTGDYDPAVGILDHGRVVEANLPAAVTSPFKTAVAGRIQFL